MAIKNFKLYMDEELKKFVTPEAKNELLCIWYRYMFGYIPFRSGLMASLIDIPDDTKDFKISPEAALGLALQAIEADPENVIRFKAPYAQRQYYGDDFNFTKDLHPKAQARFAQVALELHREQILREFTGYILNKNKE